MQTIKHLILAGLVLLGGCVHYADRETPPGTVPPPTPSVPITVPQASSAAVEQQAASAEPTSGIVIREFGTAYSKQKNPKIAVFLNRELSADIQEWHTPARLVVEGKMKVDRTGVSAVHDKQTVGNVAQRDVAQVAGGETTVKGKDGKFYEQVKLPDDRLAPPEAWMWQFEESFLAPFLDAKTVLLDRATVMRLAASDADAGKGKGKELNPKQIEIEALKGKADLFMEILVHRNPLSPVGYEFKVSVKEVSTGRLLSTVSSLTWKQEKLKRLSGGRVIATQRGYQVTDDPFPKLERVAAGLAEDVMRKLAAIWSGA